MLAVALVRGINVGGVTIRSAELGSLFDRCGFTPNLSLLQSGNVVFEMSDLASEQAESLLQEESYKSFSRDLLWFVRTPEQWSEVVQHNPFEDLAQADPSHLLVHFGKEPFEADEIGRMISEWDGPESMVGRGRELYAAFPDGIGTSRLFKDRRWLKLTAQTTGRNWNTILKIRNLLATGL